MPRAINNSPIEHSTGAAQNMLVNHSYIAVFMAQHVAPGFVHLVSFLLPADLVTLFP